MATYPHSRSSAPKTEKSLQGWTIDGSHPAHSLLNLETVFHHLESLEPIPTSKPIPPWHRDIQSFVAAKIFHILSSPLFIRSPIAAVQRILSLPNLNANEDFILHRVLQYAADAANVLSDSPAFWSEDERELVLPVLLQLFPYIRTFSLSPEQFLKLVEPMRILDTNELIQKYKFDALARQLCGEGSRNAQGHTLGTIKRCYKDLDVRRDILKHKLRGSVAISESPHPYSEGMENQVLEEIALAPWTPRILVEFDRRTCIGIGGQLMFYKDREATDVIASWHDMFPRGGHGVKTFVVNGNKFYLGFRSCFFDQTMWGWKLIATPLFQPQDFE